MQLDHLCIKARLFHPASYVLFCPGLPHNIVEEAVWERANFESDGKGYGPAAGASWADAGTLG